MSINDADFYWFPTSNNMIAHRIRETARGIWQLVITPLIAELFALAVVTFIAWTALMLLLAVEFGRFELLLRTLQALALPIIGIYAMSAFIAGMASFILAHGRWGLEPKLFRVVFAPLLTKV